MIHRFLCVLTLLFSLSGSAMGEYSDFGSSSLAPKTPTRFIEGVEVKSHGQVLQRGTVDLKPTLDRIKNGGSHPHRNDGSVFQNRPNRGSTTPELPVKPQGYYTEYVHPTVGNGAPTRGPGPQRVVTGQGGEIYYTPDHYQTFIPVNP